MLILIAQIQMSVLIVSSKVKTIEILYWWSACSGSLHFINTLILNCFHHKISLNSVEFILFIYLFGSGTRLTLYMSNFDLVICIWPGNYWM